MSLNASRNRTRGLACRAARLVVAPHTHRARRYLCSHGCDEMQGYHFSRPLPADEFAALLREGRSLTFGAA